MIGFSRSQIDGSVVWGGAAAPTRVMACSFVLVSVDGRAMRGGAIGVAATVDGSEKVEVVLETTK